MTDDKLPKKDPEKEWDDKDEELLHVTAMMLGLNQLAADATVLGTKVFYRIMREEAHERFKQLGGEIDHLTEPPTLTLPTRPEIKFYETDIEGMRQLVAEYDARKK